MVSSRMTNNGPKSLKRSATPEDRPHSQRVRARSSSITSEPTNPDPKIKVEEQDKKEEKSIQDKSKKTDEENDKLPIDLTAFDKAAARIEREGEISFRVVQNDGSDDSHIVLTGLKNVFMKQLPKMPREYITRLVFDRSHQSMAIIKSNPAMSIVGGITFRPISDRGFAEIVFCAVASSEQVQGFGAHLMNHLKDYIAGTSPIRHFLTYADNYAIGYFKKQGFTKDITLDKSIWTGYIKDYEGGTLMQGTILPSIRYVYGAATLALQKAAILKIIKENTRSNIVYPGISAFKRSNKPIKPEDVPGLKEGGWSPEMNALAEKPKRKPFHSVLQMILTEMQNHPSSWPFLQPVSKEDVPDYYKVIKYPMDLSAMEEKLENNCYETFEQFINDCYLIFDNCRSYNDESTTYYKNATKLEKFLKQQLKDTEYHHLIPN